jgi:hypothetical protein
VPGRKRRVHAAGQARRELVWINVTAHPTAEWIAQQVTESFPWNEAPRYVIRDRDGIYGAAVTRRLRAMGIRDEPISPGSPWQNGYVERLIGTIRRECLDHMIVFGEAHLRRILRKYAAFIMSRELIAHSTKMLHFRSRLSTPVSSDHDLSLAAFITNIAESDFRYTQGSFAIAINRPRE